MPTLRELEERSRAELERLRDRDATGTLRKADAANLATVMRLVLRGEKITEEELRIRARAGQL